MRSAPSEQYDYVSDRKVVGSLRKVKKYSSLAQLVEHAAVNRRVVGSSPTGGAKQKSTSKEVLFCYPIRRIGM